MADQKITDLTAYTPPIDTDVLPIVDVTTSTTKKITWTSIKAALKTYFDGVYTSVVKATSAELDTGTDDAKFATALAIAGRAEKDGWTPARETWTYASATTITVPAGATTKYQKGDKIRFQNNDSGTYLYAYVVTVASTLLTVLGDAVPSATLTDNYYSKAENPQGFPLLTYTPTVTAMSGSITTYTAEGTYQIIGNRIQVKVKVSITNNGTGATGLTISTPIASNPTYYHPVYGYNHSSAYAMVGRTTNIATIEAYKYDGTYAGVTFNVFAIYEY